MTIRHNSQRSQSLTGFSYASKKGEQVSVHVDSLALAPKSFLENIADNKLDPIKSKPLNDFEWYFFTLLRFLHKKLPWDEVNTQNIPDSAKAKRILEKRSSNNGVSIDFCLFESIEISNNFTIHSSLTDIGSPGKR